MDGFNTWAFNQLNQLTPSTGNSPQNGTSDNQSRNFYSLSYPVSGEALSASLEAWSSVSFPSTEQGGGPVDYTAFLDPFATSFVDPILSLPSVAAGEVGEITVIKTPEAGVSGSSPADSAETAISKGKTKKRKASEDPKGLTDEQLNQLAVEEDKRRRNTAASARFRVKKKQREQALEQSAKELKEKVQSLEKEVEALKTENGWLRGLITGNKEGGEN